MMDHDEAIRWVNRELAGLPRESTSKMDRKFRAELIGLLGVLQTGKRTGQIVFERLMPLCPCSYDPDGDGPQRDCPIHGDGVTFVALCRWRDAVVAALTTFREVEHGNAMALSERGAAAFDRLRDLLAAGPWAAPAAPSSPAAQVIGTAAELEIQGREGIRDVGWF